MIKYFIPVKFELAHQTLQVISSARTEFGLFKALFIWQRAMWEWTFLMPNIMWKRRGIQKSRKLTPDELDNLLSPIDD